MSRAPVTIVILSVVARRRTEIRKATSEAVVRDEHEISIESAYGTGDGARERVRKKSFPAEIETRVISVTDTRGESASLGCTDRRDRWR